uniref:Uncharacterized protein n=1 Tax=Vibrio tasmaniensis TaxID=212663 RepID=A0A0H3ZN88_9VIBR|nr:hypothetical protein [Vibrio tasmaniensis]
MLPNSSIKVFFQREVMFEGILKKLGYVKKSHIDEQLNFA